MHIFNFSTSNTTNCKTACIRFETLKLKKKIILEPGALNYINNLSQTALILLFVWIRSKNITLDTYFLLGVSAKHFRDDVSTTVSQKVTTGSAT